MKKVLVFIFALVIVLSLCACGASSPAPAPAPEATQAPQSSPEPTVEATAAPSGAVEPLCIKDGGSLSADLDGDGAEDTVTILSWTVDEFGSMQYGLSIAGSSGTSVEWSERYMESKPVLWLADTNNDSKAEIIFCGDAASDDFFTVCLSWDGQTAANIAFSDAVDGAMDGCVEKINNGILTIGANQYVLGTYGGKRDYALNSQGVIAPVDNSIWVFENNEIWLTTTREIQAILSCAGCTLPAGTELRLTGFNGVDTVYFVNRDGTEGNLYVEKNESLWGWVIDGTEEAECFDFLPYAG